MTPAQRQYVAPHRRGKRPFLSHDQLLKGAGAGYRWHCGGGWMGLERIYTLASGEQFKPDEIRYAKRDAVGRIRMSGRNAHEKRHGCDVRAFRRKLEDEAHEYPEGPHRGYWLFISTWPAMGMSIRRVKQSIRESGRNLPCST